ncbi:hypothetical protein SAMN06297382_2735 [Amphiplicatus metriothermophilus]|uniref:Helix-hairpin-helix domain-containing protein n=1 Tax=Amphiplicatus metriothermophilus TaxID=1519374 RepID=A0A239PZ39_9PROT|nr:hypothetical protein [Amphiplicatus metriothermophilus]SNT75430.1 hypothetical protein SAMN06297382_2735 [Amphiplicatus metriothermophilus]
MTRDAEVSSAGDLPKLAAPARRALVSAGLTSLDKLSKAKGRDVARLHGMGPKAMAALKTALAARGLRFAKE